MIEELKKLAEATGKEWHLGSMNDGLFIINARPRPSGTDAPPQLHRDGPTMVLNVTDLPDSKAQAICDAHNAARSAITALIERVERAEAENARLREALEFYAEPVNFLNSPPWEEDPECFTPNAVPFTTQEDGAKVCDCGDTDTGPDGEGKGGWWYKDEWFETAEAAKSAAQADYESRVLSALSVSVPAQEAEPVAWQRKDMFGKWITLPSDWTEAENLSICEYRPLYLHPTPAHSGEREAPHWREMDSAPLDGKHCILAVKCGAFIYSVQGAYGDGQWDCAFGDNVKPLYWMPNVRLPDGWESKLAAQEEKP